MPISESSIQVLPNGYRFTWLEGLEQVATVQINRLLEDSRHVVTGELLVNLIPDDVTPYEQNAVSGIRLNLMSQRARQGIVKRLYDIKPLIPWDEIIEYVCSETLNRYRQGEPAIKIGKIVDREKPRYRIEPIIFEDEANLLYGDGDTGKSTIASLFAVLVQDNISVLGLIPQSGNVLYLDWETSEQTVKENITAIRRGLNVKPPEPEEADILYRFCARPLSDDAEELQGIVAESNVDFIVVDSLGMACGGDIERLEFARAYFASLRSLRTTSLSLHHLAKQSDGSKPYGSVYFWNIPRSEFLLKHDQQPGEAELNIGLYHKKCNIASKIKPFGVKVEFCVEGETTSKIIFSNTNLLDIPNLATGLPIRQRVIANLRSGSQSISELAEELGERQDTIRRVLDRYKGKDFVKLDKKWGLLESGTLF